MRKGFFTLCLGTALCVSSFGQETLTPVEKTRVKFYTEWAKKFSEAKTPEEQKKLLTEKDEFDAKTPSRVVGTGAMTSAILRSPEYVAIQKDRTEFNQEWVKKLSAAKTPEEREKINQERLVFEGPLADRTFKLMQGCKEETDCLALLLPILRSGKKETSISAIELVLERFPKTERLAPLVSSISMMQGADELLTVLENKVKIDEVKALARLGAAEYMISRAESSSVDKKLDPALQTKMLEDAKAKVLSVLKDFPEAKVTVGNRVINAKKEAEKWSYYLENLTIGKKIPDAGGQDLVGNNTKLKGYEGKVVVMDVWATWCGPCRAMIPHEREMVERLKEKPFVLLSVSTDEKKETLEEFLKKEPMPWDHWWVGRAQTFMDAYNIRFFPTIFVIDHEGVIRYKNIRGEQLEKAVEELLKKVPAKKASRD